MASDIAQWLEGLGLVQYAQAFAENDVRLDVLKDLTDADLRELGVSLGDRKRIFRAITDLTGGSSADPPATATPEPLPSAQAERRQLTVLFCDLVGSTALAARLDPEDMRELLRDYQDACSSVIIGYEGYVAKFMGDGVYAYFGYPAAHEDDAERAIIAGLGIVKAVGVLGRDLAVRIGIATGTVAVGDIVGEGASEEAAIVGEAPNLAARLQEIAEPNSVVISQATHKLASGLFETADLGKHDMKGFPNPVGAWVVERPRRTETRFDATHAENLTELIGREEEMDILLRRWKRTKAGEGQVALVSGEPGIGKSRLARELEDGIAEEPHYRLRYQCSPYRTNSALHPVIDQLERAAKFDVSDGANDKLDKIEALIGRSGSSQEDVPLIAALLSIPYEDRYEALALTPQQQKERTLQALVVQLSALAADRPVLFIFEDAHWTDPTTLDLLNLIIESLKTAPVLVVITYRPDFAAPWTGGPNVTLLALTRLTGRERVKLIEQVAAGTALSEGVIDQIVAKTDGVPLFVEELTKTVVEAGVDQAPDVHAIPATLQDALAARLDRLREARAAAQIGAVIGRSFNHDLLARVADSDDHDVRRDLNLLVDAGLVLRRGEPPEAIYTFKHALVQDTAYQSLLKTQRRALHGRIAEILAQDDSSQSAPEILAHHYTEAGLAEEAVRAWERAGNAALERAALREATQHFRAALAQLVLLPESSERDLTELRILTRFGSAVINIEGWASSEAEILHERARELAGRLDTSAELVSALVGQWLYRTGRAQHDVAAEISQQLFHIARKLDDPELLLQAHHAAWPTLMLQGDPIKASSSVDHGLAIYDETRHRHHAQIYMGHDPAVCGYSLGARVKWTLGLADQAAEYSNKAIALARRTEHVPSLVHGLMMVCHWHASMADHESALEAAEELYALSEAHELAVGLNVAQTFRGWARAKMGEVKQGIRDLRDSLEAWQRSGARVYVPPRLLFLAEAYSANGDYDDARAALEQALREIAETGERQYEAEIHCRRGRILLDQNAENRALAERSLRVSRDVARRQSALAYELRATVVLAELWSDDGKRVEARESLADVIGRFKEGFSTPDLMDAKVFLDELA